MTRLFVKKLTVIDFSYLHSERGLLGESWLVDVELSGRLDQQGMVLDFSDVKKTIKKLIDDEFDHKLIIPSLFAGSRTEVHGERIENTFTTLRQEIFTHTAPASAYCFIDCAEISPLQLQQSIEKRLMELLPENVEKVTLNIYPEQQTGAFYHYSHGLRQHSGNCQRIAHGHRSQLQIYDSNGRREDIEQYWAERWHDIYIASHGDIAEQFSVGDTGYLRFHYHACQGEFELSLPKQRCYLIDTDSTVENLARHLAQQTAQHHPDGRFRIHAYEGIDKGAIEESNTDPA